MMSGYWSEDFDIYEDTDLRPGTLPDIFTTIEEELYPNLPPPHVTQLSAVMEDMEESTQQIQGRERSTI